MTAKPMKAGEAQAPAIDAFRGRRLDLADRQIATEFGRAKVTIDGRKARSPGWRGGAAATGAP